MTEAEYIARAAAALDDIPTARGSTMRPTTNHEGEKK